MLAGLVTAWIIAPFGISAVQAPAQQQEPEKDKGLQAKEIKAYDTWLDEWQKRTGKTIPKKQIGELENDIETGAGYVPSVEKDNKLSKDEAMIARVERVGGEIAAIAQDMRVNCLWGDGRLNPFPYKFKVIEGKDVNAFSLPGGYIYVYEGLMNFVESDDELAAVLSHEISHASLRHLSTMIKEQNKFDAWALPALIVAIISQSQAGSSALILKNLVDTVKQSGWSVKAEKAADYAGFQYMQASNYNPVAALTFMERLARTQRTLDAIDWGIFRTHPPSRERADMITQYLNESKIPIKRSQVSLSFRVTVQTSKIDGSFDGVFGGRTLFTFVGGDAKLRADTAAKKLNDFFDQVPDLFEVQANPDGSLYGHKKPLLKFTLEDASGDEKNLERLANSSATAVKRSLYLLAYRVWDVK